MKLTHKILVGRAERWLRAGAHVPGWRGRVTRYRCAVILTERNGTGFECPDAIGWANHGRTSILIECKASRSDFLADRNKLFRAHDKAWMGMGRYRYYLTPRRLIKPSELPPQWGLIEVSEHRSWVTKLAEEHQGYARWSEMQMLWSELAKYQLAWNGVTLWPCQQKALIEATCNHFKAVEEQHRKPMIVYIKRRKKNVNSVGG